MPLYFVVLEANSLLHENGSGKLSNGVMSCKDQENPTFSAFDTLGSLSNDPIFDPGRLGKRFGWYGNYKKCMQNQKERVQKFA